MCSHKLKIPNKSDGDFHSVAWVIPKRWDFGVLGVPRGSRTIFFKHGNVVYQKDGDDEQNRMSVKFSS